MDEAAAKEAAEEAAEEAMAKEAMDKKVEAGAAEGPSSSGQTPSLAVGAKREATPSGSTPPAKRPYKGVWKPRFVNFPVFSFLHLVARLIFHYSSPFLRSTPSSNMSPSSRTSRLATAVVPEVATGDGPPTPECHTPKFPILECD
jgi:hypothetical protein